MGKKSTKIRKKRYPRKALVPIYWVIIGISFIFVWILPIHYLYIYQSYIEGMIIGLAIWTPFMVGAIIYSNYFQRQGIRICNNCGKHAYKGKKYCEKCGARVFWECPKCHAKTSHGLKFCKECGQSLEAVTFARQVELEESPKETTKPTQEKENNVIVTGSVVQFCPACGAEITEDLTHCSICGSKFDR